LIPDQTNNNKDMLMLKQFVAALVFLIVAQSAIAGPKIEHWVTDNGLRVYYVHAPQLPMLDLRLVFAAGSARDGQNSGIAMLTSSMLNKGAGGLNADQIAEAFESVGANYSAGSGHDRSWVSLRTVTMKEQQDKALQTWLKVISKPDFPEKDFLRLIKQVLVGLEAEKQDPGSIASRAFFKHLYGSHPYATASNGDEKTIKAMKLEQLKSFYSKYYVAQNGLLAIVGDVALDEAKAIANQVASVLKSGQKAGAIPPVPDYKGGETIRIDFPSSQSHVYIGQIGDKRGDRDYFPLYLGNHVLGGGGFTSRLMKEIRVKRGLSYSVYSYFMPLKEPGPFILGLQTKNEQADEAVKVSKEFLAQYVKDGPDEAELEQSRKNITGGFPLRIASNSDIVSYIAMIGFYELPLDYLDNFSTTIKSVTRAQVIDAFKRRLHPDNMLTVIVGKGVGKSAGNKPGSDTNDQADTNVDNDTGKKTAEPNEKKARETAGAK
jgi:zinc protease